MIRLVLLASIIFLAVNAAPATASDAIYKWVDEHGVTHYSAHPPEGVDYERIATGARGAGPTSRATETPAEQAEAAPVVQPPELPVLSERQPDPEMIAERCEQARQNMMWLTQRTRILLQSESGEERMLDEEDRQRMIAETQDFIDEWC